MSNPWFRMYAEVVDDDKLRLLAFEDRWHYVALLSLKCSGLLDSEADLPMLLRRVAVKLGLSTRELEEVARRLADVRLIDRETLQPLKWDDRQFISDNSTERVRAFRERQKQSKQGNGDETFQKRPKIQNTETEDSTPPVVPPSTKAKRKGSKVTLTEWLTDLRERGEQAIPADDPVVAYADNAGIPRDFLRLAWWVFRERFTADGEQAGKEYIDWRAAFRNYVKNGYLRLWALKAGQYELTTVGAQNLAAMTNDGEKRNGTA